MDHGKSLIYFNNAIGKCEQSLFVWLVADGWCWFVMREEYWWLVCSERKVLLAGG
jgi:hypothetical protein